ncbi:MAG TPA: DUF4388 domain-containing protein [Thermoanaerobaculia bacterium]|nr:DUF4388 domain-containing protein [Thermoanaerobaculia bacterium]
MAVEGTLDLFKLPEILQLVAQQRKTGILTVQGQQDIIAISFLNGQIVAADALNQTVEEGLAQILVGEGLMTANDFSRAAAEYPASGLRLLDFLVERLYVARPELLRALRIQMTRLLEQLLRWDKGEFKFYSGDEVSYEEGFIPIPVDELLFQIAQRNAAAGPRPVPAPAPVAPGAAAAPGRPAPVPGPVAAQPPAAVAEDAAAGRPGLRVVRREAEAEAAGPFRKMKVGAPAAELGTRPITPKLLAAGFALLLGALLLVRPQAVLLPFPWQEREREALSQDLRSSLYLKIDQAAKTSFLLAGRFPANLGDLVEAGLLTRTDLRDPRGLPLRYEPGEESYTLQPMEAGKPVAGAETSEAVTGNFLLDPEILTVPAESAEHPLVLLD